MLELQMALSLVLALTLPPFSIILPRFINRSPRLVVVVVAVAVVLAAVVAAVGI